MNNTDFGPESPGKLLKNVQGHWAFLPNPLPPEIVWTDKLVHSLSVCERNIAELRGIGTRFANPRRLVRMFLRREAEFSSRIEQTYAGLRTMLLFEEMPEVQQTTPDVVEVNNNFEVLEFAFSATRRQQISLATIRQMHRILFAHTSVEPERTGRWRDRQNWIGSSSNIAEARYVPPPPHEVEPAMRALVDFINQPSDRSPFLRAAMLHYQFEAIHPFEDGNGRIGRALVLSQLSADGVLREPILNPSAQLEKRRRDYYDYLLAVSTHGGWEPWFVFFCECVAEEAKRAVQILDELDKVQLLYRSKITKTRNSALLHALLDDLIAEPVMTARRAATRLKVSAAAGVRLVEKLASLGVLQEASGKQRNRVYVAKEIVDVFSTGPSKPRNQ